MPHTRRDKVRTRSKSFGTPRSYSTRNVRSNPSGRISETPTITGQTTTTEGMPWAGLGLHGALDVAKGWQRYLALRVRMELLVPGFGTGLLPLGSWPFPNSRYRVEHVDLPDRNERILHIRDNEWARSRQWPAEAPTRAIPTGRDNHFQSRFDITRSSSANSPSAGLFFGGCLFGRLILRHQTPHTFRLGHNLHLKVDELLQIPVRVCRPTLSFRALAGGRVGLRFSKVLSGETDAMLDELVVHPHDHGTFARGHEKVHGLERLDDPSRLAPIQIVDEDDEVATGWSPRRG